MAAFRGHVAPARRLKRQRPATRLVARRDELPAAGTEVTLTPRPLPVRRRGRAGLTSVFQGLINKAIPEERLDQALKGRR
jgi:hypothetical protein